MDNLEKLSVPEIQKLFIAAMQKSVDKAILNEMIKAIENNDLERLYQVSGFSPAVLDEMLDKIESVYKQSAEANASTWPQKILTDIGVQIPTFSFRNRFVEEDLKAMSSTLVTEIDDEVREVLRNQLSGGMARGDNPKSTALNIVGRVNPQTRKREGGILGLSSGQQKWSDNARKYLETLDEKYLTLQSRDKRFDSIVKAAIKNKKPLTKENIDKLMISYNNKALKYRADMIARTETLSAINRGKAASIEALITDDKIKPEQVMKWWDDAGEDGRTRASHLYLGRKYDRKHMIPFNEPFVTFEGYQLMYPGDSSLGAPASEIIECRCRVVYYVDFITRS